MVRWSAFSALNISNTRLTLDPGQSPKAPFGPKFARQEGFMGPERHLLHRDTKAESQDEVIELRVEEIAQLFHTLDPFPFRERDLDREAEEFIVGWARELRTDQPIRIVVHFPDSEVQTKAARELSEAFRRYFSYRAEAVQRDLNE